MQFVKYLITFLIVFFSLSAHAQQKSDSLFADFDLWLLVPVIPVSKGGLSTHGLYIQKTSPKKTNHFELIKVYKDSSIAVRKATLRHFSYGNVLSFKTLKTPRYEKVFIFADWDYYHDSLLICHDTLYLKQTADNDFHLFILFPAKNDTITITCGYRNTRYDFLKKVSYEPPLKACHSWFSDVMLDYTETFTLVKKDTLYDLVKVELEGSDTHNKEYKYLREKYAAAGLSPFWLVLAGLDYKDLKK